MITALIIGAVWMVVAVIVALLVGRMLKRHDEGES